jgi:site-specific DNA-methyltransferase (adenine-specific)
MTPKKAQLILKAMKYCNESERKDFILNYVNDKKTMNYENLKGGNITDKIKVYNCDNMELMRQTPDKYYDWVCIDPPYGLGKRLSDGGGKLKNTPMAELYREKEWDVLPNEQYWEEVFRISKNQIVFGANYFLEYLPNTRGFVCWDKKQDMPTLSACELVWTSLDKPAKIMRKSSMDLKRFHPTQKPTYVYSFMFDYCKVSTTDKILDTHGGSLSIALACHDYGFDLTVCELDEDYYNDGVKRLKTHIQQQTLF